MYQILEIITLLALIVIQSIFGVGLLLFGTPSFLVMGYDFANTINILMPVSITISFLQFYRSKVTDRNFIKSYNIYCLPCLVIFLRIIFFKFLNTELESFEFEKTFALNNFGDLLKDVKVILYYSFVYLTQLPIMTLGILVLIYNLYRFKLDKIIVFNLVVFIITKPLSYFPLGVLPPVRLVLAACIKIYLLFLLYIADIYINTYT